MLKLIFISSFLFITFLSCQKNNTVEPYNYKNDTPTWLKEKIDSMTTNPKYYWGTKVYRYEWDGKYVYHISIAISSCMYCELYEQDGKKLQLDNVTFPDFLQNKKNEVLVWEWKK